ncbi:MAG: histidine kinase [Bacteroidota bacterium]
MAWLVRFAVMASAVYLVFVYGGQFLTIGLSSPYPVESILFKAGDDPQWKAVDFDDSAWDERISVDSKTYWWRARVVLDSIKHRDGPLGLGIRSSFGAYEVYWDGHFIGQNGVVGNGKSNERPGGIDGIFLIPEMLGYAGEHLLAVRVSQHRLLGSKTMPFLKISDYDVQSRTLIIIAAFMHVLAGVFFVIALYYFFVFAKSYHKWSFLVFGMVSIILFLWILLEYVKFYYAYPYHLHYLRLDAISLFAGGVAFLLPLFFIIQFELKRGWIILGFFGAFIVIVWYLESDYDRLTFYWVTVSTILSMVIAGWALIRERSYAGEALIGLIPLLMASAFFEPFYYDRLLFFSFTVFIIVNLYILSKLIGDERQAYELSRYRTERLKIELLKKNIQPHYLMNTLTALISWVEESPKTAQQFIEALAEEFEALRSVSEKQLIPINEEISLCNAHLEVMKFRNEVNYQLSTKDVDPTEFIPPAIFLTLLENGITHNKHVSSNAVFELVFERRQHKKIYTFYSPGVQAKSEKMNSKGTGLKYVEARLKENYGDRWTMESFANDNIWITKIIIKQ